MVADFYAMLGVNPGANRAALEAALARCQPVWSSGTRNPKTKHTYQSYLDQIPEIRRIFLGEPASRIAYDAELAASRRAERDAKLDELQRLVRLRAAKGGLTVSDRTLLREQAGRLGLTPDDLERLVEPIPPKPETPAEVEAVEPPPDVLDPVARKQIRVALDHLRRSDLYDALGLARDAPPAEVAARADAERQRWMRKTQVTAEKTAWLEVVSHAQSHLGTPASRARYDRTLALEAEERFGESIAFAIKGLPKLDYGTRAALIAEAAANGIITERADILIGRGCRHLGVARDAAPALFLTTIEPPRYLRCRSCSGVTDHSDAANPANRPECRHCRASLQWTCPLCKRVRWVDEPRCPCGFLLEQVEPLTRHWEAAQQAHRELDHEAALDHLRRVQQYAPNHAGARKGIETVRRLLAQAETARQAFESARARRHLVAAREALGDWAKVVAPETPELVAALDEVARALRMAQTLAARGRASEADDPPAARAFHVKALAIAADLAEAREGLLRCPPDPPANLVAEFAGDRVRLRWTPPPPDGLGPVRFRVVRKRGQVPTQINDGATVVETAESEAEDRDIQPGDSAGYSVFTCRGPAWSRTGPQAGPVAALPDVTEVRVEAKEGEVALSWTTPAGASGVRVVRNQRRPLHDRDGELVAALPDGLVDRGLQDDRAFFYAIHALYPTPDGPERVSRGVTVTAVPHAPVAAVAAPTLTPALNGGVGITWQPPARGLVRVIRTPNPLPHAPGDRLAPAVVATWDGTWIEGAADGRAEDQSPPAAGVCYYTPVAAWAGGATVGHPARYSCLPDPSDLRVVRAGAGGRVHLRWRWSPRGTESRVIARAGSPPLGPDDPASLMASVSDEEYSRLGYFAVSLPPSTAGPWHLAVFNVAHLQGEELISPGLDPSARTVVPGPNPEVVLTYTLNRPTFPGRPWSVTFRTEPTGMPIPPSALVVHPRTVPLSSDDGEIVARFPATQDGITLPIPTTTTSLNRNRARIFADPSAAPDGSSPIRIRHPEGVARV